MAATSPTSSTLLATPPSSQRRSYNELRIQPWIELTRKKSSPERHAALLALVLADPQHRNPRITARWREMLTSDDSDDIFDALDSLRAMAMSAGASLEIDWLSLLFHPEERIRRSSRTTMNLWAWTHPNIAKTLAQSLQQVLEDPQRADDHIDAIRGLAVFDKQSTDAHELLDKLMMDHAQPMAVRVAAMKAVERITLDESTKDRLREVFLAENKHRQQTSEFQQEFAQLEQAIEDEERLSGVMRRNLRSFRQDGNP